VSGYDSAERSAKKRPCAIFVGESQKKKGSCGGFPNPRETIKRNRTCGCSTIGRAGKGYPPVPYSTWSQSGERNLKGTIGNILAPFFFPFFFLGSPRLLICLPRNLPPERFLESPFPSLYELIAHVAPRHFEFGRTERGYSSLLGVQPTIGSVSNLGL
jgi:hypothetical protein